MSHSADFAIGHVFLTQLGGGVGGGFLCGGGGGGWPSGREVSRIEC